MNRPVIVVAWVIALMANAVRADPSPRITAWKLGQLNEQFMRGLTKQQCMTKTIASLTECSTRACMQNLAGVMGDCVTWAAGDLEAFCASYDLEYLRSYCGSNELDARSCLVLTSGKSVLCKNPKVPLKQR